MKKIKAGFRPSQVRVASERLYRANLPIGEELCLDISLYDHLLAVEDTKRSIFGGLATVRVTLLDARVSLLPMT